MRCFRVVLIVRTDEEMLDIGSVSQHVENSVSFRGFIRKCDIVQIQELGK